MEKLKKMLAGMLTVLLILPFLFTEAYAETVNGSSKRWNIVLVVDGSGSLFSGTTTDPDGLRFEAIDDLLGILEDNGNTVGAIVFSANHTNKTSDEAMQTGIRMNTGMISFDEAAPDGGDAKDYISNKIRGASLDYGSGGTTDIGTALLVAEEMVEKQQAENGLDSVIFLFTDGVTELDGSDAYQKSLENLKEAEKRMESNSIKLCGVYLNKDGRYSSTEVRDIVCAANGVASNTLALGDTYIEIENSASCHAAMERFMRLLGYSSSDSTTIYDDTEFTFRIPGVGVEEANIRLYSLNGETLPDKLSVTITSPDGTVLSGSTVEAISRKGRTFRNYKLTNPESGTWTVTVDVPDNNAVGIVYAPVFSLSMETAIELNPSNVDDFHVNMDVQVEGYLTQNGVRITDPAAYREYDCVFEMRNLQTGEVKSYQIIPNGNNAYVTDISLDTYGTFETQLYFNCDGISTSSESQVWNLENHAPTSTNSTLKVKYGLFRPSNFTYDMSQNVYDIEDGDNLDISILQASCNEEAVEIDGTTLKLVSKKVGNGVLNLVAKDTQGATTKYTVNIKTENVTVSTLLEIIFALALIAVITIIILRNRAKLDGECKLSFTCNNENVEITLPPPGSVGKRRVTLAELIEKELGYDGSISQTCNEAGIDYDSVEETLKDESELSKVKLSIVGAKVSGKKKKQGKLNVTYGKRKTSLYGNAINLELSGNVYVLAYYPQEEESGDGDWDGGNDDWSAASDDSWGSGKSQDDDWA